MPTPINPTEKTNFLNLVKVAPYPGGPSAINTLSTFFNNYEDIAQAINGQIDLYGENNSYLTECIGVFDDTQLQAVGIYNKKTSNSQADPKFVINSSYSTGITVTADTDQVAIIGSSVVRRITLSSGVKIGTLIIGPGSAVDVLDASASGAAVENIILPFANNIPAILNAVVINSNIGSVQVEQGSYFGGIDNNDPQLTCAKAVTGLTASNVTHDSIALSWTPASDGYLFINVFYRKSESAPWVAVTDDIGYYVSTNGIYTGYIFQKLPPDTYFDFKVAVRCNNGGVATTILTNKTVCCGSSVNLDMDTCLFYVKIKTSPGPATQILCDGTTILQEYPEGPTLTIPELAGKNVERDIVIQGITYQQFDFNPSTGVFNAATSSKANFVDGDVLSIRLKK